MGSTLDLTQTAQEVVRVLVPRLADSADEKVFEKSPGNPMGWAPGLEVRGTLEQRLTGLSPAFTTAQACQALLSPRDLAYLVTEGETAELSRGIYRRADAPETARADLLAVSTRAPQERSLHPALKHSYTPGGTPPTTLVAGAVQPLVGREERPLQLAFNRMRRCTREVIEPRRGG